MPVVPCPSPCPPITRGLVQFSSTEFNAAYPEFAGINAAVQQNWFTVGACVSLNNTCGSLIQDATLRMALLYLLTAHWLTLMVGKDDGNGNTSPAQGIVGRISSATQGSVNVSSEYSSEVTQSQAFYIQTPYGAGYWDQTSPYRSMVYVGAPSVGPNSPGFPFPGAGPWNY